MTHMVCVRPARPEDVEDLIDLFIEVDTFYSEATAGTREERRAQIESVLFAAAPIAYALLAHQGEVLVGLASYSFLWPAAGLSYSLYLKELFVREDHRGSGVGSALMGYLENTAKESGCTRMEWTTEAANRDARAFYSHRGATILDGKVMYRV